ncbi:MAG: efflux transporter, family, subunit [Verrucomicrobiales bacterium]|nr:efflux transporter, family, subunit [Verrucomicrobiales bacterium]
MADQKSWRWLKWLVALLVLGGVSFAAYYFIKSRGDNEPEYKTSPVGRGDITQVVTATGILNPLLSVQVGSQISGAIQKIMVDYNSPVTEGQVIAQIDPATYQASVHQAEGDLANAKAALELTRLNAKRAEELVKSKLIAQADYDKATADWHQAEAQVKLKEASLERAKVDLSRCTIYAPVSGIVISRSVDVGQTVAASFNTPTLFLIANDLAKMQIDANVSEADIGGIEVGQSVKFTVDAFPTRTFHGKVTQVRNAPITVQNVVTYDTVIEVSNADLKLKPGMTANVSIVIAERNGVLTIPNGAFRFKPAESTAPKKLAAPATSSNAATAEVQGEKSEGQPKGQRRQGGGGGGNWSGKRSGQSRGEASPNRTVYTLSKGANGQQPEPKPVQIKIGISDGISTEVVEGLSEGDTIIVGMNAQTSAPGAPSSNPFGGGSMRRF